MKWIFILLNIGAAIAVVIAGAMLCRIHDVHSYSTFAYLKKEGALSPNSAGSVNVEERLKSIGGLDGNLPPVTYAAAGIFVLNAAAFFFGWQKRLPQSRPAT